MPGSRPNRPRGRDGVDRPQSTAHIDVTSAAHIDVPDGSEDSDCSTGDERLWSRAMLQTGYLHSGYAASLEAIGKPVSLPGSGGMLLWRTIPGTTECDA